MQRIPGWTGQKTSGRNEKWEAEWYEWDAVSQMEYIIYTHHILLLLSLSITTNKSLDICDTRNPVLKRMYNKKSTWISKACAKHVFVRVESYNVFSSHLEIFVDVSFQYNCVGVITRRRDKPWEKPWETEDVLTVLLRCLKVTQEQYSLVYTIGLTHALKEYSF